ncbi:monovalent cation:proton antiporter-2 (CPA2) family protein [Francisellaceae bacterium CB299]
MSILTQAAFFLLFAVITVPIAKKLKLGSVLGYLIAGVLLGPLFGLIDTEIESIQHFSEFGVVMMMFLIGLELKPNEIWSMRYQLIGLGGLQVLLTTVLLSFVATFIFGFSWNISIAIGLILSLSSTAIVLQSTQEAKQMNTKAGQSILSVLISQDIAVIPIFAILPLLVVESVSSSTNTSTHQSFIGDLPGFAQAIIILVTICLMIIIGKFTLRYIFRYIAKTKLAEIFTALVLLLVISVSILMESLGLSAALGAFIAGVILSENEYRHEIESQISPFKGLLMGIFFISIGASINFILLWDNWEYILLGTILLISIKMITLMVLARIYKLKKSDFWLFSLSLAQGGEFAFVLLGFALTLSLITPYTVNIITLIVIISMLFTPLLFLFYEKKIMLIYQNKNNKEADNFDHSSKIIIAGAGRFGQIAARILTSNNYNPIILDSDATTIQTFRKYGAVAYYGDALTPGLLMSAGISTAKVFIAAIDDRSDQTELVSMLRRHHKELIIIARARDRHHVYELENAGANYTIRETFESANLAAIEALTALGEDRKIAESKINTFKKHDENSLKAMKEIWLKNGEDKNYINEANINRDFLTKLMQRESDIANHS